ncbi:tetraspanin-16 isoform X1 [Elephas maximus indicus]|uniref:tetraspanin-16 isoform X1 n=1 Tax=Elephas maximus indicus TaxID=99487 RepID=UPI0021171601|nr:tetraspanin-16 isoform X1 [Elephas maximus indicus]
MAEMHTPYSSLKKLLFFLNGLVAMSGVLLIGLGTWVNGGPTLTRVLGLSSAYLLHIGYLCLAMGCITVLLGFAGWYGATKENRGILLFCFLSLVVIVLMEITVATVILAFFPIVQDMAFEHILMTLRKNYRGYNEPDDYSTEWNSAMAKLRCCGVSNYTDFSGSSFEITGGHTYPRSCCKSIRTTACDGHNVSRDVIHQEGCFLKLMRITRIQSFTLSGGSLGAVAIKLPGILTTLLLFAKLG